MYEPNDSALLERYRDGDRQALLELFKRYEKPVYNVALRITGNREDAADVAQTVFMKAFENHHRFDPKHRFFSWIYRIAVNESIRSAEQGSRLQALSEREESAAKGPESTAGSQQLSDAVQDSLMQLDAKYRAVLVMKHFLGLSYREIGASLEISEQLVKSRLYSARQLMQASLQARQIA